MLNVEEIDRNIRELVLDLNNKGYETMFSCGGHVGLNSTEIYVSVKRNEYIDDYIKSGNEIHIPKGFQLEIQDGVDFYNKLLQIEEENEWLSSLTSDFFHRVTIRTIREVSDLLPDSQFLIDDMVKRLTKWVRSLPNIKNET